MPRGKHKIQARTSRRFRVHLAPGVRLDRGEEAPERLVLISPEGSVQLNEAAVAILRLCDGSRTREEIVARIASRPRGNRLASDIAEFLDVARSRGWIVEA